MACPLAATTEDFRAIQKAAANITAAPRIVRVRLSVSMRPIVMIARPVIARINGRYPQRRQAGVRKKASGIPATIKIAYARNHFEPGTLIPNGASSSTRHAGHLGRNAKIRDDSDDENSEYAGAVVRGTISRY